MESRQILLVVIVIALLMMAGVYIGVPAWKDDSKSLDEIPHHLQESYEVPYKNPQSEYSYYSLYGWRVNPPYEYPQKTINTPYDTIMRNCSAFCNNRPLGRDCLEDCRLKALDLAINNSKFFPSEKQLEKERGTVSIENYSEVTRSLPSHTSPMYRSLKDETKPFCFYR